MNFLIRANSGQFLRIINPQFDFKLSFYRRKTLVTRGLRQQQRPLDQRVRDRGLGMRDRAQAPELSQRRAADLRLTGIEAGLSPEGSPSGIARFRRCFRRN